MPHQKLLTWLEQGDPLLLAEFLKTRRFILLRQLPLACATGLMYVAGKNTGTFHAGHPAALALMALTVAALLWPHGAIRLARLARGATTGFPKHRTRLNAFAALQYVRIACFVGMVVLLGSLTLLAALPP